METEQAAAPEPPPTPAADDAANALLPTLDPQLFMAARGGDSKQLKKLLLLEDDDEEQAAAITRPDPTTAVDTPSGEAAQQVVVEVDPPPAAAAAAAAGPSSPRPHSAPSSSLPLPLAVDGVTIEGDTLLHVVAACGDGSKFLDCAKMIVRDKENKGGAAAKRLLLQARNNKGDTPLHCAAGAGNADMISFLVGLADTTDEAAFLRLQNHCRENALHQAVRAAKNKLPCVTRLMDVDPELACIPPEGEEGTSPMYLAVSLGDMGIARHLFERTKGNLSYSGPHGRNVLHAAVSRGQALCTLLDWLEELKTAEMGSEGQQGDRRYADVILQLTSQRDMQADGSSPLHLAAALSGWPSAVFLHEWFPQLWWTSSGPATCLLLNANLSTAYQPDSKGLYPIHVAALSGSLSGVGQLLLMCPDCATLRDGDGRTFLHVAASRKSSAYVVAYACRKRSLSSILNAQDKDGDTALHKAVRAGSVAAVDCLVRNRQVRLDVPNKEALTPLDLSWSMMPAGAYYRMNPRSMIRQTLQFCGAPHGASRADLFHENQEAEWDKDKASEIYKDSTQALGIVAVLIATVTFASAFTLPGGYRADGTPVLAGSYAFDAFVVADTLAFICSSLATVSLVYTGVPAMELSVRQGYMNIAVFFLHSAGRSFVPAFGLGFYLVLSPVRHAIAAVVCVVIASAAFVYGNMEIWKFFFILNTVRARTVRIPAGRRHACTLLFNLLFQYWSVIIIFALPAIVK